METFPVVLFAYKRPQHTARVLERLAQNVGASEMALIVFADGAKPGASVTDLEAIAATRALLERPWPFKRVTLHAAPANMGLKNAVIGGLSTVLQHHAAAIVLEDDIEVGPWFFRYMQHELRLHLQASHVAGVSGFAYPVRKGYLPPAHYLLPIGCSWGWAVYARSWQALQTDVALLLAQIAPLQQRFDFGGYPFFSILQGQSHGTVDSWAILFYASFFLQGQQFVLPQRSLSQNAGFGTAATHTVQRDYFFDRVQASALEPPLPPQPAEAHAATTTEIAHCFRAQLVERTPPGLLARTKGWIKRLILRA